MIKFIAETFNNREISFAFWLIVLFLFFLTKKDIRASFVNVIKAFFVKKIFTVYLLMTLYVFLLITVLYNIGFWKWALLKETIFWYFGIAFVSLINVTKANQDHTYFKKMFNDNLKLVVLLEFITSLYSFNLIIELILVPLLLLIAMISGYVGVYKEHKEVKSVVDNLLAIIGICIFTYAIYKIISDLSSFSTIMNLTSFLLPPTLTFLFVPFIYLFAVIVSYETLFVRLNFFIKDKNRCKYAKWRIIYSFHLRLRTLNLFAKEYYALNEECENDIKRAIKIFKNNYLHKLKTV